jgi:pilus assembly protein CpaB
MTPDAGLPAGPGAPAPDARPLQTSETIMRNVRVLATDQRFDNQPTPDGKTQVSNFSLVTLETTPKMAEKIAVAQKIGSLSLSLRPLADSTTALEKAVSAGDIKVPAGTDPKADKTMLLDVASEPQDTGTTFTTGAEVSRFARGSGRGPMLAQNSGRPAPAMLAPPAAPVIHVARGNTVTDAPVGGK